MTVLVTGVAGFIGSSTARALLARGDRVVGIDNLNDYYDPSLKRARLERLSADFGDRFHFEQVDFANSAALDELGALIGLRPHRPSRARRPASATAWRTRRPMSGRTSSATATCSSSPGTARSSHFVYASSSSVYGGNKSLPFRVEDRVDHPLSLYAATKKADELMSEAYANLFRLPSTGLRFFTVYGPWGRPDMAMWIFTKALFAGEPLPLFNHGEMRRDFTYIDDIVARRRSPASTARPPTMARPRPAGARARMPSTISATTAAKT